MAKRKYNRPRITVYNISPINIIASSIENYPITFEVETENNIDWSTKTDYSVWNNK